MNQNQFDEDTCGITVQGEEAVTLLCERGLDYDDPEGDEQAADQLFQDEYGVWPNHNESEDALLEIVAVPDDVGIPAYYFPEPKWIGRE